jgi:hypothetical protein
VCLFYVRSLLSLCCFLCVFSVFCVCVCVCLFALSVCVAVGRLFCVWLLVGCSVWLLVVCSVWLLVGCYVSLGCLLCVSWVVCSVCWFVCSVCLLVVCSVSVGCLFCMSVVRVCWVSDSWLSVVRVCRLSVILHVFCVLCGSVVCECVCVWCLLLCVCWLSIRSVFCSLFLLFSVSGLLGVVCRCRMSCLFVVVCSFSVVCVCVCVCLTESRIHTSAL